MVDQTDKTTENSEQAVRRVETTAGTVTAVSADGTRVQLNAGDPVFQGDTIITSEGFAVGVMLVDETVFSMGQSEKRFWTKRSMMRQLRKDRSFCR